MHKEITSLPQPNNDQFRKDFDKIAFLLTDEDWHKAPHPHNIEGLPPFRTYDLPRRLEVGPLRRIAQLIGISALRYIFVLGSSTSHTTYKLELSKRKIPRSTWSGKTWHRIHRELKAEEFGHAVLKLEATGIQRARAMQSIAKRMRLPARDSRSLERLFSEFKRLSARRGYVRNPIDQLMPSLPQFSLSDLDAKVGRPKKTTTK